MAYKGNKQYQRKFKPAAPVVSKHDHVGEMIWPDVPHQFGDEAICKGCGQTWHWDPTRGWVVQRFRPT